MLFQQSVVDKNNFCLTDWILGSTVLIILGMSYQFVLIFREKGRLNENILRLCCFFLVLWLLFVFGVKNKDSSLNSLFFNASEFIGVAFWKISFADDRSDSVLLIYLGNSLKTVFGQLELLLMYTGWLSGFLYGS